MSGGDAGIQLELHVGCQLEYPPVTSPHGLLAASQRGSWVLRGSLPEKPRRIYIVFYDLVLNHPTYLLTAHNVPDWDVVEWKEAWKTHILE